MEIVEDIKELPMLDPDSVHIWGLHVPDHLDRMDALLSLLNNGEREKAMRYRRASDRRSSIAARGALRILLSGYTSVPVHAIEFTYTENGKPQVSDSRLEFNVSHSNDWIVLAFGLDRKIGVDIEKIRHDVDIAAVAERCFSAEEKDSIRASDDAHAMFFRIWARKEAYVKASGSTLFAELKRLSVPVADRAEKEGWFYHCLEAGSKYAAAVVTDRPVARIPCYDFGGLRWEN